MRLASSIAAWLDRTLRERRFSRAARPGSSAPPWIAGAESFSALDANPMASIPAAKIAWLDLASRSSRLLSRYGHELQQAASTLEATRARQAFGGARLDDAELGALERQRRSLGMEREALCLLARCARLRLAEPERESGIDEPRHALAGMTPLSYFVSIRRLDAVELLLELGADPEAPGLDGASAVAIASRKAQAYAGAPACSAAVDAACILSILEARCLSGGAGGKPQPREPRLRL